MKQTVLIISLAQLLFTGMVSADQRMDNQQGDDHALMQRLLDQQQKQQSQRYHPSERYQAPVIIKLLQRKRADEIVKTYHT